MRASNEKSEKKGRDQETPLKEERQPKTWGKNLEQVGLVQQLNHRSNSQKQGVNDVWAKKGSTEMMMRERELSVTRQRERIWNDERETEWEREGIRNDAWERRNERKREREQH
jgi:hypothetical protein